MSCAWGRAGVLVAVSLAIAPTANAAENSNYSYDALGRLVRACHVSSSTAHKTSYSLDDAGNRQGYDSVGTVRTLEIGGSIVSADGRFSLVMQSDGNLVQHGPYGAMWSSQTHGSGAAVAAFQSDGNLALYTSSGVAVWHASTHGNACASLSLQNDGNLVIQRADGVPLWSNNAGSELAPVLSIGDANVTEGGALAFNVTRSRDTATAVGASYATVSGSAISGSDFNASSGVVSFAAGETSKIIYVGTIDDTDVEPAETMTVMLASPTGGAAITTAVGTGTIFDNDVAPAVLSIGNASVTEGGTLSFPVMRTGNTGVAASAAYATANGSAAAGSDYWGTSGTVSFGAGQTSQMINVVTIADSAFEADETLTVNLSSPSSGAAIGMATGTGTIHDYRVSQASWNSFMTLGSASYVAISRTQFVTVSPGHRLVGTANLGYDVNATANVSRSLNAKWQYSVGGANSWIDFGAGVTGSVARAGYYGPVDYVEPVAGWVTVNQAVSGLPAGNYDVRLVALINNNATYQLHVGGGASMEAKP